MKVTLTQLRQNIYRIVDRVLETGQPVEIERRGKTLRIIPVEPKDKVRNLAARPYLLTEPEELVHLDWSQEWKP